MLQTSENSLPSPTKILPVSKVIKILAYKKNYSKSLCGIEEIWFGVAMQDINGKQIKIIQSIYDVSVEIAWKFFFNLEGLIFWQFDENQQEQTGC